MIEERPKHRRRARNFLIDKRFQLKYAVAISITGSVIFAVMSWFLFAEIRQNSELAVLEHAPTATPAPRISIHREALVEAAPKAPQPTFAAELSARLEAEDKPVVWTLAGFCLALAGVLFLIGIFATHRIVGPITVIDRALTRLGEGEPLSPRPLRRGDEFKGFFTRVNEVAVKLAAQRHDEAELLRQVVAKLNQRASEDPTLKGWLDQVAAPLEALARQKDQK